MPVWKTTQVDDEPEIILGSWSVRELPDGDRHFVGYTNAHGGEGRVAGCCWCLCRRVCVGPSVGVKCCT